MQEQRFKILVVDDDEGVRDSLKAILEDEYDVWDAEGGQTALNLFTSIKPDLVYLDLVLPDMGGLDVLKKIKRICPLTPVAILTAYSNISGALHALESGASDYIPKPFGVNEIQLRTAELLESEKSKPLDCEILRQRWLSRKKNVRARFLTTAFVPFS